MRYLKMWLLLIIDIFLVNMGFLFAINIAYEDRFSEISKVYSTDFLIVTIIYILSLYIFKMYRSLWDFTGTDELLYGLGGNIIAIILIALYTNILGAGIPSNVIAIAFLLISIFVLGIRELYRFYRRLMIIIPDENTRNKKRVMIVGAGYAGTMLINEMLSKKGFKYRPVVLIDDDRYKIGKRISGIKIKGNRFDIPELVKEEKIDLVLIAIPSIDIVSKTEIIEICKKANCKVKIIPGIYEIIRGDVSVSKLKDVELEDLLGREKVSLDNDGISEYLENKTVLVTGGGGSIGSELCRQIACFSPKQIIIFDIYENNAYDIQNELKFNFPGLKLTTLIGSIRDSVRLEEVFKEYDIDVIFHAAAHKHVPLMEDSPKEAIKNNVFGTYNLAKLSDKYKVKRFVLISTDKAVNPTNIMGATKRLCEMIIQAMDINSETEFVAVRFGNVLGSNGSVIPLFKRQISEGGPLTVTHKNITRYFMLIPEAAQLVLQAGAFAKGGEIFVLDMGKPVKIYDLAVDLIKLSGLEPNKDIKIDITGLRPGEKLYEELLMSEEGLVNTSHNMIYIGKPTYITIDILEKKLKQLNDLLEIKDLNLIKIKMMEIVPTYRSSVKKEIAVELD